MLEPTDSELDNKVGPKLGLTIHSMYRESSSIPRVDMDEI